MNADRSEIQADHACPHYPRCSPADWSSERAGGFTDAPTFAEWCNELDAPPLPSPLTIVLIDKRTGEVVS